jgi:P-type Cu+ transporter
LKSNQPINSLKEHKKYLPEKCFHCGEDCFDKNLYFDEKYFCCNGCQTVYQLLNKTGLCSYYDLNEHAGINRNEIARSNKFAFLEEPSIMQSIIEFREAGQAYTTFYIPAIHCSSCVYLLENLNRIDPGIVRVDIQFLKKEVRIIFDEKKISLRKVVETLVSIGYEPHISLQQLDKKTSKIDRSLIYRLGVAGFCFGNIMLLSFPEYFAHDANQEQYLGNIFRYLNVVLAMPVFFYSAGVFFSSAWTGIKHKHLNIDFPVALAILVTFVRSLTEVFSGMGGGYFDSMTGIVFFMLVGRVLQDKTYGQLSFERNYTDYFPIAATLITKDGQEIPTPLPNIKPGDTIRVHDNELITADGILVKGKAQIDYSFVTGESVPIEKEMGEIIYAGGKQLGGVIEILTMKEVAQSYLTGLWNKETRANDHKKNIGRNSFVHKLARNFTWIVLGIAFTAAIYWWQHDAGKIWPAVTAVLIIACPCGLLLTSTFTNGYLMRILGRNGLFLRNANVIEIFGKLNHIVFDKTGTLTSSGTITATYKGIELSADEKNQIASLAVPTTHALSKPVKSLLAANAIFPVKQFKEHAGLGAEGFVEGHSIKIGTASFMNIKSLDPSLSGTALFIEIDGIQKGCFVLSQRLRPGLRDMLARLQKNISVSLLSGDEPYQKEYFSEILGDHAHIRFNQKPFDKLNYIEELQSSGKVVGMTGDGLNDAGALRQSDVGICIAEDTNNFTPAGDAILEGKKLHNLDKLIRLCAKGKNIIKLCFGFSVLYNLAGIYFAVQGILSPLIAAILMPCSTLTIVLLTYVISNRTAKRLGLDN